MLLNLLLPATISFFITTFATPLTIKLAKKWGLVDDPQKRKHPAHIHKGIIPRAGGLPIFLGIFATTCLFLAPTKKLVGILLGATLTVAVGLWDDWRDLNPYFRLITNLVAASLVVGAGVGIPYMTNPFGGVIHLDQPRIYFNFLGPHTVWVLADIFALLWITWTMNMVNWSKGVPGQLPGIVVIAAITLGILSYRFALNDPHQIPVTMLSFITAGSFLGFLLFNFPPQKIMPGYGGGSLAGYMLAVLSILSFGKVATALLVLGVPTMDAVFTVARRVAAGRSPVWADRGHLHHKLLDLGWTFRQVALFYWLVCAILGALALNLDSERKFFAGLILGVITLGGLLWLTKFLALSKAPDQNNGSKT